MPGGLFCAIGNPLNDGTWTYTWQNGRQLKKMQKSDETVEFVYNENGLRVQKTATSTGVTKYTLHGKNIEFTESILEEDIEHLEIVERSR